MHWRVVGVVVRVRPRRMVHRRMVHSRRRRHGRWLGTALKRRHLQEQISRKCHVAASEVEVVQHGLAALRLLGHALGVLQHVLGVRLEVGHDVLVVGLGDLAVLDLLLHRLLRRLILALHVLCRKLPALEAEFVVGIIGDGESGDEKEQEHPPDALPHDHGGALSLGATSSSSAATPCVR